MLVQSRGEGEGRERRAPEDRMELCVRSCPSPADAQRELACEMLRAVLASGVLKTACARLCGSA
eukprot:4431097-Lingulodinium_polyedra.AAC.1